MRRRLLLGEGVKEYVFSAATSVNVDSGGTSTSISIKSTADGENIGYTVVSYDSPVTAVTTAATYFTISYSANPTISQRSGSVVLKQNGSNNVITITVNQLGKAIYGYHQGIILDATSNSTGSTRLRNNIVVTGTTSKYNLDWADVTYSNGEINVTATSANNSSTCRTGITTVTIYGQNINFTVIQMPMPSSYSSIDGHQYLSFNGTKWAVKNVGASSIGDGGNYYQYGKGAAQFSTTSGDSAYTGTENPLSYSLDTARQVMGGDWRMPTADEFSYLDNHIYSSTYCSYNGSNFMALKERWNNTVYLFLPCDGYYSNDGVYRTSNAAYLASKPNGTSYSWWLSVEGDVKYNGWHVDISSTSYLSRSYGAHVRGVHD